MSPRVSSANREQYLENRRENILEAAVRVFGKKGYSGANVADIAKEAGIGKGTVYLYFKSKEEIFVSVLLERSFVPRLAEMMEDVETPVDQMFLNLAKSYLDFMDQELELFHLVLSDLHHFPDQTDHVYSEIILKGMCIIEEYLKKKITRGEVRPLENPQLTAQAFMSMLVFHIVSQEYLGGKSIAPVSHEQWAKEVVNIIYERLKPV